MRERVTFIHDPAKVDFEPTKQLRVDKKSLGITGLVAGREDQLTLNVDELPQEIWLALKQCRTLRIRWASPEPYEAVAPFNARVSPGLHVFYTPQGSIEDATLICPLLLKIFGETVRCESPARSFTATPKLSERFTPSAAYSYHARLDSLGDLGMYFLQKVCPGLGERCLEHASVIASGASLAVDWNTNARTLTLTSYRDSDDRGSAWNAKFTSAKTSRLEVGVLARESPTPRDAENLALGGFLTVVGRDTKPDSVLFTFPSRHHDAPGVTSGGSNYAMSFLTPTGLHPTMRLSLAPTAPPLASHCALYAHLTLPSVLFPDKYQLSAPLFLASHNLRSVRGVWGETDLEAPDWAVSRWGSQLLLELAPPSYSSSSSSSSSSWHADVPLHLRYLAPTASGHAPAAVPWPVVFWACRAPLSSSSEPAANLSENPFDRVELGYNGLFAPSTLFYHLQPNVSVKTNPSASASAGASASTPLLEEIQVPVLPTTTTSSQTLETVTAATIVAGVAWVLWKLLLHTPTTATTTKDRKNPPKTTKTKPKTKAAAQKKTL